MKQSVVRDLTTDELRDKIGEEQDSYIKLKMSHAVSPIENPMKISATRKLVARMITELHKRETESLNK